MQLKIKLFVNVEDVLFVFFPCTQEKKINFHVLYNLAMIMSYSFNFN